MAEFRPQAKERFAAQAKPFPLVVHCARGGMRSGSVAWLLETAGLNVVKVTGGYSLTERGLGRTLPRSPIFVFSGTTESGTQILKRRGSMGAPGADLKRAGTSAPFLATWTAHPNLLPSNGNTATGSIDLGRESAHLDGKREPCHRDGASAPGIVRRPKTSARLGGQPDRREAR